MIKTIRIRYVPPTLTSGVPCTCEGSMAARRMWA